MKCPNCNKEVPDGMNFCGICSTPLQQGSISGQSTMPRSAGSGESVGEMRTMAGKKASYRSVGAGEVIADRYRIIEVLGAGGMGEVYRCLDMKLNRDVAVKRLLPDIKASKEGIERFLREGQAIAGLNHQNIVQIHDLGEDEQGHYIVMELIEGDTLKKVVRDRDEEKLSPEEVRKVASQIGRGLSYAHRQGVVHRDIKPGNIMLAKDGTVKITDFGLAQVASESELSMTGYGMGTLDYMPPEQRRDAKHTDHRADIYAFGATLYEMTTGKPPRTIRESEIPGEMREVILKSMEAKPADRFFSVDEMVDALKKPGKAIDVSESDVKKGACPSCGNLNPLAVKFCEECGAGLFEKCPKCEEDIRIGTKHCGYCGVKVVRQKDKLDSLITNPNQKLMDLGKGYFEWEGNKYPREVKEKQSGVEMVLIAPGEFEMGSNTGDENATPVHRVSIARPFYLGKYPVTQEQFQEIMGNNPSYFNGTDNLPVEQVTWHDAKKFCGNIGEGCRLPTEAEWEYACRAGTKTEYYWGDKIDGDYCWSEKNSKMGGIFSERRTHPIGEKKPNSWGLYDMNGNVWEWCEDDYHNSYDGAPSDGITWGGGDTGNSKVLRGGSWFDSPGILRSASRNRYNPSFTLDINGFRIAWSL